MDVKRKQRSGGKVILYILTAPGLYKLKNWGNKKKEKNIDNKRMYLNLNAHTHRTIS